MAGIAYDANGAGLGSSSLGSFTFAFTVGGGTNRILFVCAGHVSTTEQITAITYNGVALTKIGYAANGSGTALWYLIAPASGANNLVFTALGGSTVFVGASSYSGAKQSGQPDASVVDTTHAASAGGDQAFTTSVTTVADQDWIIAASTGPLYQTGAFSDCTLLADQNSHSDVLYHKGPVTPAGSNSITIDTAFSGGTGGPTVLAAFSPVPSGGLFGAPSLDGLSIAGPKQFPRIK
jgi:hypothetical protein